jgi:acyl-CoA synthetase (NDP forming)
MAVTSPSGIRGFFEPTSIAVVGVSTDQSKLASIIFSNLVRNKERGKLKASVYPLNPSHNFVGGQKCYPRFDALPEVPELAVIVVPASLAVAVVKDAAKVGVKAAVMITGGFAEAGKKELEQEMLAAARKSGMRLLGPNTIGLLDTTSGVDSLFLRRTKRLRTGREVVSLLKPLKGGVVIITQSGHLGEIVSEELAVNGIGLRALVGTGNQLDISVEDVVEYFAGDARAKVIAVYLEGVEDGRRFMRVASAAAKAKPVIVFKMGKTRAGALAALTHTASLVGDYEVYRAAFREAGVVEAESLQELVDYCVTFSLLGQRPGRRLLISTNAGGVGAVAADEAELNGLDVNPLSVETSSAVRSCLGKSSFVSTTALSNPLDLTATVTTESFVKATEMALASADYDMALVLPTHQTPAIDPDISERMAKSLLRTAKPVCVCVMGRATLAKMINADFLRRGIPSFPTPERAVRALAALSSYAALSSNSTAPPVVSSRDRMSFLAGASGPLSPPMIGRLLSEYDVPQPRSVFLGPSADPAEAGDLRFPIACKLVSSELLHKTEAGGVILNVSDAAELASAVSRLRRLATQLRIKFEGVLVQEMAGEGTELLLGSTRNRVFGPTLVLGAGGKYAELIRDYSLAIAPLGIDAAKGLVTGEKISPLLSGYRGGQRVRIDELARVVSRFSKILVENPSINQIEVNPLIASEDGVTAVDVRAIVGSL